MTLSENYFTLARAEEISGQTIPALPHYLSSFCAGFSPGANRYPYQATAKIRRLQLALRMTDGQLLTCVHSYGPLTDDECRLLLYHSVYRRFSGIQAILSGHTAEGGTYETANRQ